uniref:Integrin beta n=1 Tax=Ciona savignyi TaxID=51511 RepID=H2Y4F0_CIOSA
NQFSIPDAILSDPCEAAVTCDACIQLKPECTWCADNRTMPGTRRKKYLCCFFSHVNRNVDCEAGFVENPISTSTPTKDEPFSNVTSAVFENPATANMTILQLKPQAINVKLRPGHTKTVNITFRKVVDYPLDLYYVMDLSNSMSDDLATLKGLGDSLAADISNVTKNVRLGFGTFVDKVVMPFASTVPEQLRDPCLKIGNQTCAPVFGFRHQLPITADGSLFRQAVNSTLISGNIDSPEGGFDALMQIAVCQSNIQWRAEALRVILYTSDASPHIALDGKLAAILEANDMKCHLESGVHSELPNAVVYSKSKVLDYPSIGQLKHVFNQNKIQTIFAVTQSVYDLYLGLPQLLDNSFVGKLRSDSQNVVQVIADSYNKLKGKVQLTRPTKPANVDMIYRVLCPNTTWLDNSLECNNIEIGDEITFQLQLTARTCPQNKAQKDSMLVTSNSLKDEVAITIEYICDCNCQLSALPNNTQCSSAGSLACGTCNCNSGRDGSQCQCSSTGEAVSRNCSIDADCTQGNGYCECGKCECNSFYFGRLCECRPTGCADNCGGPDKGTCINCNNDRRCLCNKAEGYHINNQTNSCICNNKYCAVAGGALCNGRGDCDCNTCKCHDTRLYSGTTCQTCNLPECTGIDGTCAGTDIKECAECIYDNNRLRKVRIDDIRQECASLCSAKNLGNWQTMETLVDCTKCAPGESTGQCSFCTNIDGQYTHRCAVTASASGCQVNYVIMWDTNRKQYFLAVRNFNNANDCPQPINPWLIVGPVVGGIVLIGLIILIAWKVFQTLKDKREYEQFIEESKNKTWSQGNNPLYSKASVRIENPAF